MNQTIERCRSMRAFGLESAKLVAAPSRFLCVCFNALCLATVSPRNDYAENNMEAAEPGRHEPVGEFRQ